MPNNEEDKVILEMNTIEGIYFINALAARIRELTPGPRSAETICEVATLNGLAGRIAPQLQGLVFQEDLATALQREREAKDAQ